MSLLGALSSSKLAMMAQSQGMQTISTNIANVNTTAYKREDTLFKTLLNGTNSGNIDSYSVKPFDRRAVMQQGVIASTGRADDLAINGRGFFVVSNAFNSMGESNVSFTRDGAFSQRYVDIGNGTQQSYYTTAGGQFVMGWPATDGQFTIGTEMSSLQPMRAFALDELLGQASTEALMAANIPSNTAIGDSVSVHGSIYDAAFNSQSLTYTFNKTSANNWTVDFSVAGGTVTAPAAGTQAVTFFGNGKVQAPQDAVQMEVTWDDGTTSSIAVDLSEMEQYADETIVYRTEQNGSSTGRLYDESFDENGVLWGHYTNGRQIPLFKTAIAEFTAPNNLEAVTGNLFKATENAGDVTLRDLENEAESTTIQVGNLERSNVDLGQEFTRMVTVQTAYSMASKTYTTVDGMVEVAATMKR
jgi:flagellar hook protein FlgE